MRERSSKSLSKNGTKPEMFGGYPTSTCTTKGFQCIARGYSFYALLYLQCKNWPCNYTHFKLSHKKNGYLTASTLTIYQPNYVHYIRDIYLYVRKRQRLRWICMHIHQKSRYPYKPLNTVSYLTFNKIRLAKTQTVGLNLQHYLLIFRQFLDITMD